jgi:flagellar motor protein MotB
MEQTTVSKRRSIDVWASFADLLSVLLVLALAGVAISASKANFEKAERSKVTKELTDSLKNAENLEKNVETLEKEVSINVGMLTKTQGELKNLIANLTERNNVLELEKRSLSDQISATAVRNKKLAEATNKVQDALSGLPYKLQEDQSILIPGEVATFNTNETESRVQLTMLRSVMGKFCENMNTIKGLAPGSLVMEIEGHTDSAQCQDPKTGRVFRPFCNWQISSDRAGKFLELMKTHEVCKLSDIFLFRAVGIADTVAPESGDPKRITIRVVPNYKSLLTEQKSVN